MFHRGAGALLRRCCLVVAGLAAIVAASTPVGATPITIDSFQGTASTLTVWDEDTYRIATQTASAAGSAIGGQRQVTLAWQSGDGDSEVVVNRRNSKTLMLSNDAATAGTLTLLYGSGGDLNANLAAGGNNKFEITVKSADISCPVDISVGTFNGSGYNWSTAHAFTGTISSDTPLDYLFTSFVGTANMADVDRIQVTMAAPLSGDYTIKSITVIPGTVVPEPATLAVVLAGGAMLLWKRRKARE